MTPQVRVAAVIEREGRILVVEHRKRAQRYWVLPGGRLEANETLSQALARELKEELSLKGTVGRLLAVYETLAPDRHTVNLAFKVAIGSAAPSIDPADEVLSSWRWMEVDELGRADFRPPLAQVLSEMTAEAFSGPVRLLGDTWTPADR
ncbi:MAG TPA: NUDIX hydrolase [Candidatus Dormibacteraeota bacterium]